jgi:predicted amidohydrolase
MAAARAVENQVVWVSANQSGPWGAVRFLGHAQVVDPDGVVRASTDGEGGVAIAHIDVGREIDAQRGHIDHLSDRRPAAYAASAGRHGAARASLPLSGG